LLPICTVDEVSTPTAREQMAGLVKERKPELVICFVTERELNERLSTNPSCCATEVGPQEIGGQYNDHTGRGAQLLCPLESHRERLLTGQQTDFGEYPTKAPRVEGGCRDA
jgi:hypothetical protein